MVLEEKSKNFVCWHTRSKNFEFYCVITKFSDWIFVETDHVFYTAVFPRVKRK